MDLVRTAWETKDMRPEAPCMLVTRHSQYSCCKGDVEIRTAPATRPAASLGSQPEGTLHSRLQTMVTETPAFKQLCQELTLPSIRPLMAKKAEHRASNALCDYKVFDSFATLQTVVWHEVIHKIGMYVPCFTLELV